jgi:hypothetical protein
MKIYRNHSRDYQNRYNIDSTDNNNTLNVVKLARKRFQWNLLDGCIIPEPATMLCGPNGEWRKVYIQSLPADPTDNDL